MKNVFKLFGTQIRWICAIAFVAVIGFSFVALSLTGCDNGNGDDGGGSTDIASFAGTWNASGGRSIVFSENTFNYKVNGTTQYSGTFSVSGSKITFNESSLGKASGNFTLSATTLVLSKHTWDSSVNGTYTKSGTGNFDTTALDAAIQEAVSARDGIEKASDASEVPTGKKWVTESEWNTFDDVYKTAVETKTNPSSQSAVDTAKANLQAALVIFNTAKKAGSAAAITLSGTITVKNNGQTVPYVMIEAHTDDWDWKEIIKIPSSAANTQWSIITKPFSISTDIFFDISGYDNDKYENALFSEITAVEKATVHNTNENNININLDLNFITISGTLKFDYGKIIPSIRIDINKKDGNNVRLGSINLLNVGNNTQWSTIIPSQTADTDVVFNIVGFAGPIPYEYDQLFALWEKDFGVKVRNQDKTGIALNLITISGTINVTYNGSRVPSVTVHVFKKGSDDDDNEWLANTELHNPSANAPWSLIIPAFTNNTEITIGVGGDDDDIFLFWWWYHWDDNATRIYAKDRNVTITLNPGNIEGDGGDTTFNSIADFATWLAAQPANTAATAYNVKLNVSTLGGSYSTPGSLGYTIRNNSNKFIILDLSESSITNLGLDDFNGCDSLISITIPNSVNNIASDTFAGCDNLTAINVNANNTAYSSENGILYNKNKSTLVRYPRGKTGGSFTIPNTVTGIGENAFAYCTDLTGITIPSGVTGIGVQAFYNCTGLTVIAIPNTVANIGNFAFTGCSKLTAINVDANNTAYCAENGVLYNKNKSTLVRYPAAKTGNSFTIPNTVTSIAGSAFSGSKNLTGVTIPSGVISIEIFAFEYCTSLTGITIPNTVTTIGAWAFSGCTSLTSVTFEGTITSGNFSSGASFFGDLRAKYLTGGTGTYTTTAPVSSSSVWTKGGGGNSNGLGNKVYMAGYEGSSARAMSWNGDISQQLSDVTSRASSVFVSGADVYIAGFVSSSDYRAILWKNGTAQTLSNTSSQAKSVFVSGSDVYVAGYNDSKATLWKNGTAQTLGSLGSVAYSVFVSGSNVYVAGNVGDTSEYNNANRATLWVNGIAQTLSASPSNANSVYVSGSDVYVAGVVYAEGNFRATLWKNGTAQTLNNTPSVAYNVLVSGSDVYVAGLTAESITLGESGSFSQSYTSAMLWKNGTEQQISTPMSQARSVFVSGSDVYVGGFGQTNVSTSRFAKIWKNGTEYIIGNASSYIHSVFVLP